MKTVLRYSLPVRKIYNVHDNKNFQYCQCVCEYRNTDEMINEFIFR